MTTARGLLQPTVGGDVGAWGGYLNTNFSTINRMFGDLLEVGVASGATLSLADMTYGIIRLTGTLTGNVDVTFQHAGGTWLIDNQTTGNYYARLKTTAANTATVGVPQGTVTQVYIDVVSSSRQGFKFADDARPGTLWQTGYDSSPVWLSACTTNGSTALLPWISCDGSEYSQTLYPFLYQILGITWRNTGGRADPSAGNFRVPDLQNSVLVSSKPSSPLITSPVSGINGATVGSQGYNQSTALTEAQLPTVTIGGSVTITQQPAFSITTITGTVAGGGTSFFSPGGGAGLSSSGVVRSTDVAATYSGYSFGSGAAHTSVQPTTIHGLTFIKS